MIQILFFLKQSINNCLAKFRLDAWDIQEPPLSAARRQMETTPMASYGSQILGTQPWAPHTEGRKTGSHHTDKQWKDREGQGRESASEKSLHA